MEELFLASWNYVELEFYKIVAGHFDVGVFFFFFASDRQMLNFDRELSTFDEVVSPL